MSEAAQPLPTIPGPVLPIGPALERELALLLEGPEPAESVVAWAFERGLVLRTNLAADVVMMPVSRDGTARAVRITAPPPPPPRLDRTRGVSEWAPMMPARRRQ